MSAALVPEVAVARDHVRGSGGPALLLFGDYECPYTRLAYRSVQKLEAEDCLRTGGWWVHLRLCLACGHVGCCDSSPNRHATAHARTSQHPSIRPLEQGEDWCWCYEDGIVFRVDLAGTEA